MRRLLGKAAWDADDVRDDVRGLVVDELGDAGAVLILYDTGGLVASAMPSAGSEVHVFAQTEGVGEQIRRTPV
jgi:hypothetical protein